MKKWLVFLLLMLVFFGLNNKKASAIEQNYQINKIEAKVSIQKDYSLLFEETIEVDFLTPDHGIEQYLPFVEKIDQKISEIDILTITDGSGKNLPYKISKNNRERKIFIGDQNKTVKGKQIYRIRALIENQNNETEINLNAIEQNVNNQNTKETVIVESPYVKILNVFCIGECQIDQDNNIFTLTKKTPNNQAFKLKINLEKKKNIVLVHITNPNNWEKIGMTILSVIIVTIIQIWLLYGKKKQK